MRATVLAISGLLLSVAWAGCLADGGQDPATQGTDATPGSPVAASSLDRSQLTQSLLSYTIQGPSWQAMHFEITPQMWDGSWGPSQGNVDFLLAGNLSQDGTEGGYMGVGVMREPLVEQDPFTTLASFRPIGDHQGEWGYQQTLTCSSAEGNCGEEPPYYELVLLIGAQAGTVDLTMGIPERSEVMAGDFAAFLEGRTAHPALPDATGDHGIAGSYARVMMENGTVRESQLGTIEAEHAPGEQLPGDLAHGDTRTARANATLPVAGTAAIAGGFLDPLGVSESHHRWTLPPHEMAQSGNTVHVFNQPYGTTTPFTLASMQTEPGQASLEISRTLTGTTGPTENPLSPDPETPLFFTTWGWADIDFEGTFGWDWQDVIFPKDSLLTGLDKVPIHAESTVCGISFQDLCETTGHGTLELTPFQGLPGPAAASGGYADSIRGASR